MCSLPISIFIFQKSDNILITAIFCVHLQDTSIIAKAYCLLLIHLLCIVYTHILCNICYNNLNRSSEIFISYFYIHIILLGREIIILFNEINPKCCLLLIFSGRRSILKGYNFYHIATSEYRNISCILTAIFFISSIFSSL